MDTKNALLNSAEHLARSRGFDAFSFADLSKQVGIRKASIHYHFATKSALADALLSRYSERMASRLEAIESECPSGASRLEAFLKIYRDALLDGQQICLCVSFSATRDSFGDDTLKRLNQFHGLVMDWLAKVFELGRLDGSITGVTFDPKDEAYACLALVEGAQLIARAAMDPAEFDHCVRPIAGRLYPGLIPAH